MIKICAISDLHGDLPEIKPCDLVLVCGDSVPLNVQASTNGTKKWYKDKFKTWAENLPCEKVIFIAGNHELRFPGHQIVYEKLFPGSDKVTYLCHKEYIYTHDGTAYRIFGTPYCKVFGNWAYMYPDDTLRQVFNEIPENLDILITHDQPYEFGDILLQEDCYWADGSHIGNKPLLEAILAKQPRFQFNGHLHSCSHEQIMINNTAHYNVSMKDERYNIVYEPLYLEIE